MRDWKLKMMILSSLFAAIITVCAQISFNFTPEVPFTMQTFAISLTATLLGSRYGTLAVGIYLLLGAIGLPVFANLKGGLHVLVGPTGGYLLGFILSTYIVGKLTEGGKPNLARVIVANAVGLMMVYIVGVSVLKGITHMDWEKAFISGVLPFVLTDLAKLVLASVLGVAIRRRLEGAGMLLKKTTTP